MARNSGVLTGVVGAIAAFVVWYKASAKARAAVPISGGTWPAPAPVPGSIAPTGSQITAAAAVWSNLTSTTGPNTGYVNFPTGSQAAAALLPWATDGAGNYYTQWAGQIYIVGVGYTDTNGNYSAKLLGT